jgi:hypothetical protein
LTAEVMDRPRPSSGLPAMNVTIGKTRRPRHADILRRMFDPDDMRP